MTHETALDLDWDALVENIVTEDDEPVDNLFSEKQMRLLTEPLYSSWQPINPETGEPRKFLAAANVGIFYSRSQPPIVPDVFLCLDVEPHADWYAKQHRSFFVWEFDKVPEAVIEIVSNKEGGELGKKLSRYAQIDAAYYIVYDPLKQLSDDAVRIYERGFWKRYRQREDLNLTEIGLSMQIWRGEFEGKTADWLRWCDRENNLILTGAERAALETERADQEARRADQEAAARRAAEAEIAALQAELKRLREQ